MLYNRSAKGVCGMQVNAIGTNVQRNSQLRQNFEGKRDNIDAFINLDDEALKMAAYEETVKSVNDKKHKKLNNLLVGLIPVAAGVASAAITKKSFTQTGRLEKLAGFTSSSVGLLASFGVIDLICKAQKKLAEKSEKVKNFSQNNPLLTFLGTIAVSLGAIAGGSKLLSNTLGKVAGKNAKLVSKADNLLVKAGRKLDKSRVLNRISRSFSKLAQKTPSALKVAGKSVVKNAPFLLAFGALFHSLNHSAVKNREFNKHYDFYKNKQVELAQKRVSELSLQNDFMLTNPKNAEDLEQL